MVHVRMMATRVYFFANTDTTVLTMDSASARLSLQITQVLSDTSMKLGDAVPEEYSGVSFFVLFFGFSLFPRHQRVGFERSS